MVPEIETVSAQTPPTRLDSHQRMRVRAAAFHATQRYPGVVGRVLAAELLAWEEFGYHLGVGHIRELVEHLMTTPAPTQPRVAATII